MKTRSLLFTAVFLFCVGIFMVFGVDWYKVNDFSEFLVDMSEAANGQMQNSVRTQSRQQQTNETDGGGYRPVGMGCPNGKQQRPDGWCPPLQRPGIDGRIERVGSWNDAYIPNGSIIPVDRNGNIRQLRCGEAGAYPCGSVDDGGPLR